MRLAAHYGPIPLGPLVTPVDASSSSGQALREKRSIAIADAQNQDEYTTVRAAAHEHGSRSLLIVPLVQAGEAIGLIRARRDEVRPFTDAEIRLLETFADQAVIAIENVRLFHEIQARNADLHEALEYQTATAEVLGIISRSPTDVQPVLDAIVESAARVCGIDDLVLRLYEGTATRARAHVGVLLAPIPEVAAEDPGVWRMWRMEEPGALHIPDILLQRQEFPRLGTATGARTWPIAPLRHQGEVVGTLVARRMEVRPFSMAQIKLLETFADQAVIALENARLFDELKAALDRQTATSEVLGIISSSPTEVTRSIKRSPTPGPGTRLFEYTRPHCGG